jgi:tetratricopeptide (TPR) repeat protein
MRRKLDSVKLPCGERAIYRCPHVHGWLSCLARARAPRALALCWLLTLGPAVSRAQAPELESARQLFDEGVAHARSGQWELALAAFQAAYGLSPRASLLFNLASAQLRSGKLLASNANFRRFIASSDAAVTPSARRAAELQIARIEQRIPRLRIQIEGLREGDRVSLDQARVYPDELGHDMWLDPGVHTVRVDRPRGDQEVRTIAVTEGQIRVLAFRLP